MSDINRDGLNEGLWNVNNLTEAAIRKIGGTCNEKGIRLHTMLKILIEILSGAESKAKRIATKVLA